MPDWERVRTEAGHRRVVVKAAKGPGRKRSILLGFAQDVPERVDLEGPFLVQYVPNPGPTINCTS